MSIDDLVEIIGRGICDEVLRFPEQIIVHMPTNAGQEITVTSSDGKVFSIVITELKD